MTLLKPDKQTQEQKKTKFIKLLLFKFKIDRPHAVWSSLGMPPPFISILQEN